MRDVNVAGIGYLFGIDREANKFADPRRQIMLYRHAQLSPERDQVRREHAEWSQATFGNVGPVGPLKHLSKEALEAAAEPDDLSEWADMQFLLWDAQRRAGITDEQITQAMIEKLVVSKQREWPEPKDGEPRLHIKEQPAPVVPEIKDHQLRELVNALRDTAIKYGGSGQLRAKISRIVRGFMLQLQPVTNTYTSPGERLLRLFDEAVGAELPRISHLQYDSHEICAHFAKQVRAAMLQAGNSPVIPDGYVMVPMRLTAENGAKSALSGEFSETKFVNCPECFGDDECETCDGSGKIEITVPVSWTNIKEIWAKGVEHFAAAPQEVKGE